MTAPCANFDERRRHSRHGLALPGRYMLSDGSEFPCETVNISPAGIAIKGLKVGKHGERVVAYIEGLGRIEGAIARRAIGWFALDIRAPMKKVQRLIERISWLVGRESGARPERRDRERMDVWQEHTVLRTEDGREFLAELVDVSIEGAAILTDLTLAIGAFVSLGEKPAYVLRRFPGGFAVTFDQSAWAHAIGGTPASGR
jgi:hypothetical protein